MIIKLDDIGDLEALHDYDLLEKIVDLDGYGKDKPKFEGDCVTVEFHIKIDVATYIWDCFTTVKVTRGGIVFDVKEIGKPGEQRATTQEFIDFIKERCK
jgi:hypothetical protein